MNDGVTAVPTAAFRTDHEGGDAGGHLPTDDRRTRAEASR
jgi:hypothetical protein